MNIIETTKRLAWILLLALFLVACATDDSDSGNSTDEDDTGNEVTDENPDNEDPDDGDPTDTSLCDDRDSAQAAAVAGIVYTDDDDTDRSIYTGAFNVSSDTPEASLPVNLLGGASDLSTETCGDGRFFFDPVDAGTYLTEVQLPDGVLCQTRNCPHRVAGAVSSNSLTIVTAGDSVPVVGASVKFPERLAALFEPMTDVISTNIAVQGTVTDDWMPGSNNFENRLGPHIESADLIVVSLGGNDFLAYANSGMSDPQGTIDRLPAFITETMNKLLSIVDAIRERNPSVDIVYILYPDYSVSDMWSQQFGFAIGVIQPLVQQSLNQILDDLPVEEDIVLVDMYGYFEEHTELDLDDYLYDQLHVNEAGHQLYAEQIFEALGGFIVGSAGGVELTYGLAP